MKILYADHYDEKYWNFAKEYTDPNGVTRKYQNPALDWEAFDVIAPMIASSLGPASSLMDIGCGGGALTSRFVKLGFDAYGADISQYAIDNCVPSMRNRIVNCNIAEAIPRSHTCHDYLVATDLLEHIYEEDLDIAFTNMIMTAQKRMFFVICVTQPKETPFCLRKGQTVPKDKEVLAVSGHVNIQAPNYWRKFFIKHGCKIRYDLMYSFQEKRSKIDWFRQMLAWDFWATWVVDV